MRPLLSLLLSLLLLTAASPSQTQNVYEIYAIEYAKRPAPVCAADIAVGGKSTDSVGMSFYIWYLKGDNGKRIVVDAGFWEDLIGGDTSLMSYRRPDLGLRRINVDPDSVTDLVITHPHWDHIDGMDLFPNATVWMQKKDYAYFVGDAWQAGGYTVGLVKRDVLKIAKANTDGRLRLVEGDSLEIIPGVRVFTGSGHSFGSQRLLVDARPSRILLASDDSWFTYNLINELSVPLTFDQKAYVQELQRMKKHVASSDQIVTGHDARELARFPLVADRVVKIR